MIEASSHTVHRWIERAGTISFDVQGFPVRLPRTSQAGASSIRAMVRPSGRHVRARRSRPDPSSPRSSSSVEAARSPSCASAGPGSASGRAGMIVVPGVDDLREIGHGVDSVVFHGRQAALDRDVAVKVRVDSGERAGPGSLRAGGPRHRTALGSSRHRLGVRHRLCSRMVAPTWSWSTSPRRSPIASRATVRSRGARLPTSALRWRSRWSTCTGAGCCTATSSRPTSS